MDFMLYGANGYTGRLIVRRAVELGLRPLVAGRSPEEITALAGEHGLEHACFDLGDVAAVDAALGRVRVVLNAAGPFARTALPMVEGCLRTGTHYLDITGEIEVFERLHSMDAVARYAGVMLLPGAGFDVVPTDLLAAHLHRRMPDAQSLRLAFMGQGGGVSRGTALTGVENLGTGGAVRRGGRITRVPAAWRTHTVDFGFGTKPVEVTSIPWGDVATAYHSTGIPDIMVYTRMTTSQRTLLAATRRLGWLLRRRAVRSLLSAMVRARADGPDDERRERGRMLLHGEVENATGLRMAARMRTPEAYALTAVTAVEAVRAVLAGTAPPGFQTPSRIWPPDWILGLDGVQRQDAD